MMVASGYASLWTKYRWRRNRRWSLQLLTTPMSMSAVGRCQTRRLSPFCNMRLNHHRPCPRNHCVVEDEVDHRFFLFSICFFIPFLN